MNPRKSAILFVALAVVVASSARLEAGYIAPNLPAGSQYQVIFVTLHNQSQGLSSDISTYNDVVRAEAALEPTLPQGVTWNAVVSTAAVNANVNAPSTDLPVYNTAGELVAPSGLYTPDHLAAIWDVSNSLPHNSELLAFTGSNDLGTAQAAAGTGSVTEGASLLTTSYWVDAADEVNYATRSLYGLSTPITVVPEPATLTIMITATLVIAGHLLVRRRPAAAGG